MDKDGFSALQLVMERVIDLCGFWLEIPSFSIDSVAFSLLGSRGVEDGRPHTTVSAGGIWEDPA